MHLSKGFTLLELMIAVVIVSIMTAIALPSYGEYVRRSATSLTQQEMLRLAEQLERHRARNLTYRNFNPSFLYTGVSNTTVLTDVFVPGGDQNNNSKYKVELWDTSTSIPVRLTEANALGQRWAMKAYPIDVNDQKSDKILLTSTGIKCANKVLSRISYTDCGSGAEKW